LHISAGTGGRCNKKVEEDLSKEGARMGLIVVLATVATIVCFGASRPVAG